MSVLLRQARARPRLLIAVTFALLVGFLVTPHIADQFVTRALIAWNCGTCLYTALAAVMMARSSREGITRRAHLEDEGQQVVLSLVVTAVIASLVAIAGELVVSKGMSAGLRSAHVALAALTLLSSWAFMHIIFALHYAHDYYSDLAAGRDPGLDFPGKDKPQYVDFFYFAAIIGTSAQTADVSLTSTGMRRIGTVHCVVSFFFNTTVLALAVNLAATAF